MGRLENILKERRLQGVTWDELAEELPIKGNALRTAFTRKSVSDAYLEVIEKKLGIQYEPDGEESLTGEGLKKLREKAGLTQKELAFKIGVTRKTVNSHENMGHIPQSKALLYRNQLVNEAPEAYQVDFTELEVMYVPLVSKFAYAGYLGGYGDDEYIGDLPKIPFANGFRPKGKYLCFEVRGDSMTTDDRESIEEGDILLAREVRQEYWKSKLHINKWDFIIVHKTEGILVKRILEHDVERGTLLLHSLNDYYQDFTVHLSDVAQIFNIVEITQKPRR